MQKAVFPIQSHADITKAINFMHTNYTQAINEGKPLVVRIDQFTVSLCFKCHAAFDRFELGNREQSEAMFEKWLVKTELMMRRNEDVF